MRRLRTRREKPVPGPSTVVGRWLRAALLDQQELREQLETALNNGKPTGWNDDEPAVVEAACELAVREYFGDDYDVRAVTSLVSGMRSRIHSNEPPEQLATEAVIRSALAEADVMTGDINPGQKLHIRGLVTIEVRIRLGWDEAAVDRLIVAAERIASERGWNPPLAT
jgi:hypothetical protein